jgi:hypothetical protein
MLSAKQIFFKNNLELWQIFPIFAPTAANKLIPELQKQQIEYIAKEERRLRGPSVSPLNLRNFFFPFPWSLHFLSENTLSNSGIPSSEFANAAFAFSTSLFRPCSSSSLL